MHAVLSLVLFSIIGLCPAASQLCAQAVTMPPDIQAIRAKVRAGQELSEKEEARLEQWMDAVTGTGGGQTSQTGQVKQRQSPGTSAAAAGPAGGLGFCSPASVTLPANAPTDGEMRMLVARLASQHGSKLEPAALQGIEAALKAGPTSGAAAAAVFAIGGAFDEAIYTAATAVVRNSLDLLALNNLSVILSEAGDHRSSALAALYVAKKRPKSPLAAVNLAWSYFNGGAATQAETEFRRASGLAPKLAVPETGLGLIAACRGDNANAAVLLKAGLKKGYSQVAAAALGAIKQSQPPASPASGQEGSRQGGSSQGDLEGLPKGKTGDPSKMIPEMPVSPQALKNAPQAEGFRDLRTWSQGRSGELQARYRDLAAQVRRINRRATEQGNALFLPRVFDKQLFQFSNIMDLAFAARFRDLPAIGKAVERPITGASESFAGMALTKMPELNRLVDQQSQLIHEMTGCGDNEICKAAVRKKLDDVQRQMKEISSSICRQSKSQVDILIAENYKVWRVTFDALRAATPDLYAFTNPVLAEVYVPSLNELMQVQREMAVHAYFQNSAGMAATLAELDKGYQKLDCVEPPPPDPVKATSKPELPGTEGPPECPLKPPFSLSVPGFANITLGCDYASVERTVSGVRFHVSRDMRKHETTALVAVGAGYKAGTDERFEALGDLPPGAGLDAELGAGMKFGRGGAITDVFVTASMSANAGGVGAGATGTISLVNGATISGSLPGGLDGSLTGR